MDFNSDVVPDEIISIDGGQIEVHDDHMSLVGSDGGDIADIDGDGVHVELKGDWEAVIDIEGHGGVVVSRDDTDERYYLNVGDDGLIDVIVKDSEGNVIEITTRSQARPLIFTLMVVAPSTSRKTARSTCRVRMETP